jgi:diadenosine tetraphosphate (Ap4A) HIT family hydrolase
MAESVMNNNAAETLIHRMVNACRAGTYEPLITRMPAGWAVLGTSQFLRGYSLLLPDPVVPHLNDMSPQHREQFLQDMARLGDAVFKVTGALRINYAMFGNVEPALHAHVVPRYADEAPTLRTAHPWAYDWAAGPHFELRVHGELLQQLRDELSPLSGVLGSSG